MQTASPLSRSGQINSSGDARALFLKVFSGEILTAYETACVMKDLHLVRTINSGKSAQFPVTGTADAKWHTPGESIAANSYPSNFKFAERIININGMCLSSSFVPNVDELMNHYDHRSIIATELGRALAYAFDKQVMYSLIAAARTATANIPGAVSGSNVALTGGSVTKAAGRTNAKDLLDAIFEAAAVLDTKDIPSSDRYVVLAPAQYYLLINNGGSSSNITAINRDFNDAGNGSIAKGVIYEAAGIRIVKSNFVPTANLTSPLDAFFGSGNTTTGVGVQNNTFASGYAGNFTNHIGTVFHKHAVGTVKLLDLAMESEYQIERQGTLMVAKMMTGTAPLRPECAVEIKTA
jgi:hypothetical protein